MMAENETEATYDKVESTFNGKAAFVVGFLAVILALYPFHEFASTFKIPIFGGEFSLFTLSIWFLIILLSSAYLHSLNYVRYDFPKLLSIRWLSWLKYLELCGNLLYFLAVFFPLLCLILWLASSAVELIPAIIPSISSLVAGHVGVFINIFITLLSIVYSGYLILRDFGFKTKEAVEVLNDIESKLVIQAEAEIQMGELVPAILNNYEAAIATIRSTLLGEIGLIANKIPRKQLVDIAKSRSLISEKEFAVLEKLRGIRNIAAHASTKIQLDSVEVTTLLFEIKKLVTRLDVRRGKKLLQ